MKISYSLLLLVLFSQSALSQDYSFSESLYEKYDHFKEPSIEHRRFNHSDIAPLISELSNHPLFSVKQVGKSVEERPIYLIKLGSGEKEILFWSQMHGDESTATMALFDIFNFFKQENEDFADIKERLLNQVTLYFIPMLNPDGAEVFERRNALGIDVNRDALRLTSPEAQTLKRVRDSLEPDYGFNLHDQSVYYTAGRSPEPATLSFLAPAYDFEQSENEVRTRAMKLIAWLNPMLQEYIPGGVAKYSDAHEPRAFGDMIMKWGTSTILIESGGYPDDPEKQYIRKLNFVTILTAIDAIAENRFTETSKDAYYKIPENKSYLSDLLIRNVTLLRDSTEYKVDFEIRQKDNVIDDTLRYYSSSITDTGDLSTQFGYEELDAEGLIAYPGKIYPDTLQTMEEVRALNFKNLLEQGYTGVFVANAPERLYPEDIPLNVISRADYENEVKLWHTPNFILKDGEEIRYVVVNGFIYDVEKGNLEAIKNTLIEK